MRQRAGEMDQEPGDFPGEKMPAKVGPLAGFCRGAPELFQRSQLACL